MTTPMTTPTLATVPGAVPLTRCWVDPADVHVPRFQRPLTPFRLTEMGAWDEGLAGMVLLYRDRQDGLLYVIDGQHRLAKATASGVAQVHALIYEGLTYPQAAGKFRRANRLRWQVSTYQNLYAGADEGEARAVALFDLAATHGFTLAVNSHSNNGRTIRALGALVRAYDRPGGYSPRQMVDQLLGIVKEAYGHSEPLALQSDFLEGLHEFLQVYAKHPDYDRKRLVEMLTKRPASQLLRKATEFAMLGNSKKTAVAKSLLHFYNYGRQKRLPAL